MSETEKEIRRLKGKEIELRKIIDSQKHIINSERKNIDYKKLYIYLVNSIGFLIDN